MEALDALSIALDILKRRIAVRSPPLEFPPPFDVQPTAKPFGLQQSIVSDTASRESRGRETINAEANSRLQPDPGKSAKQPGTALEDDVKTVRARCQFQAILDACDGTLYWQVGDPSKNCRSAAVHCVDSLCLFALDMERHVPFLMPALLARYGPVAFNAEMQIFVHDVRRHDARLGRCRRCGARLVDCKLQCSVLRRWQHRWLRPLLAQRHWSITNLLTQFLPHPLSSRQPTQQRGLVGSFLTPITGGVGG